MSACTDRSGHRLTSPPNGGFTLIEFIIALVILAIGATLLFTFVTPTARSHDPLIQTQGRAIASAYLDELLGQPVNGSDCSSRARFDHIGCYNGLNEAPTDQFGIPLASLAAYTVNVSVDSSQNAAPIAVTVSHSSGSRLTLHALKGDY